MKNYLTLWLISCLSAAHAANYNDFDNPFHHAFENSISFVPSSPGFNRSIENLELNTVGFKKACQQSLSQNLPEFLYNACTYIAPQITQGTREAIIGARPFLINMKDDLYTFHQGLNVSPSTLNNQHPVTTSSTWSPPPTFTFQVLDPENYTIIALFSVARKN